MRRLLSLTACLALLVAVSVAPAEARIHRCGNAFSAADAPGSAVRAEHVTCSDARRAVRTIVRRGDLGPGKCSVADPCRYHRFHCVARSTADQLYRERCRRGSRVFSFGGGS